MRTRDTAVLIAAILLILGLSAYAAPRSAEQNQLLASYGKLPLSFEPNQGQAASGVKFLSHGHGYTLLLTGNEAVLALKAQSSGSAVRMKLVGANSHAEIAGSEALTGRANYFIGSDPRNWHTDVPTYSRVRYSGI